MSRLAASLALLLGAVLLTGCATVANPDPRDPLESYNRSMTNFNEQVDAMVLKPVATAYKEVTPAPVRTGVSNFFGNLGDVWSFVNNVLQLRGEAAASSFMRVNVNTFMGLGGLLDIASELGIDRYKQDFGLTLGRWGVGTGPYLVLPILGPSTVRDTFALPVDMKGNVVSYVDPVSARNSLYALAWWTRGPTCCAPARCSTAPRSTNTALRVMSTCKYAAMPVRYRMRMARTTAAPAMACCPRNLLRADGMPGRGTCSDAPPWVWPCCTCLQSATAATHASGPAPPQ